MLKVLLVGPYKGKENSSDSFLAPPFGLYRIKFYIEKKLREASIDILDPNITDYTKISDQYELIGFSLLHLTLENDLTLFNYFKSRFPKAVFVAGGIEVSFLGGEFFRYAPFDIIVLGEGEKTLLAILKNILKKKSNFDDIKSIYWKKNGNAYFTGYGEQLNLNDFKQIYKAYSPENIPYKEYWNYNAQFYERPNWKEIRVIRGSFSNFCPYRCKFCVSTNFISYSYSGKLLGGGNFHILPIKDVLEFLLNISGVYKDAETFIFDDDNMSLDLGYLERLCYGIIKLKKGNKLKKGLNFICQGRPDIFARSGKKLLGLMKKCGFRMIMYGIESFSNRMLKYLGKKINKEQALKAIDLTIDAKITPLIYIILFPPHISRKDLIETVDLCVKQLLKKIEISITPFIMDLPGSEFHYDKSLRRVIGEYRISNKSILRKSNYILPYDNQMFNLGWDIYTHYPKYEKKFKDYYGIRHVPGRVYSLIFFDMIYQKLNLVNKQKRLRRVLKSILKNLH